MTITPRHLPRLRRDFSRSLEAARLHRRTVIVNKPLIRQGDRRFESKDNSGKVADASYKEFSMQIVCGSSLISVPQRRCNILRNTPRLVPYPILPSAYSLGPRKLILLLRDDAQNPLKSSAVFSNGCICKCSPPRRICIPARDVL